MAKINSKLGETLFRIDSEVGKIEIGGERMIKHIQEEIREIEQYGYPKDIKEKKIKQLLRIQENFLNEIDLNKHGVNKSLSELNEDFIMYWQAIEGVSSVFTPAHTMEVMYNLDKKGLTPANKDKAFRFDKKLNRAVFDQSNTEFLKKRYKGGLKKLLDSEGLKDIYIGGIDSEQNTEMINHIYGAKNNFYHFTEAINFVDKYNSKNYEVTSGEKYILIDSLFARLKLKHINTLNFTQKEEQSLKNAFKTLEKYPMFYKKLDELISDGIYPPK